MNIWPMTIGSTGAFIGIMIAMVGIIGGMLVFFRSRRWI
jgi:hypothetical protein